ncbi:MAG TPA: diguanylate cyclase [Tepidisphaeraceae bacterium]|jgi:diguanylate cyclase (GGDEF)-like protein|nr:diguanylate cyclase [Tepidisphaeraceae bacterium]
MELRIALIVRTLASAPLLSTALTSNRPDVAVIRLDWEDIESSLDDVDCVIAEFDMCDCDTNHSQTLSRITQRRPLIVVSSSMHQRAAIHCFRAGVTDFIQTLEATRGNHLIRKVEAMVGDWRRLRSTEKRADQRLSDLLRQSETDELTGLCNRHFFDRLIAETPDPDRRKPLGIILVDVDNFKTINDRFGHSAGDAVLKELADIIRTEVNQYECALRWGGEEFLVLLTCDSLTETWLWAARLREQVERHVFYHQNQAVTTTISAGILRLEDQRLGYSAIEQADRALYLAKSTGRNRVCSTQMVKVEEALAESERQQLDPTARWQMLVHLCVPVLAKAQYKHVSEHCRHVSKIAGAIARQMELPEETVRQVELAGLLHDLGKLVVPEELLSKPRSLIEEEWRLMSFAMGEGCRMALRLGADEATMDCVRGRAEPYQKRTREAQPMGTKILAVADAIAAMSTDQPYRHARNATLVQAELTRCAGTQFDPQVVKTLGSLPALSLAA